MPQLDKFIISSQVFWLVFFFLVLYFSFVYFFFPKLVSVLKFRSYLGDTKGEDSWATSQQLAVRSLGSVDKTIFEYCRAISHLQRGLASFKFEFFRPFSDLYVIEGPSPISNFVFNWSTLLQRF
jgi:hypothetical protein